MYFKKRHIMANKNKMPESLEDRMLYYRGKNEQFIPKNSYVIIMLDGRSFSQKVKKRYKRPFDENFINLMDETAAYVCSQVQGAKFAYVQSDEISIFMTDAETPESTLFYDGRLVKLLSVVPSIATSYFNRHVFDDRLAVENMGADEIRQMIASEPLYQFDGKVWSVPNINEVRSWFLYRQNDCIRNSKQQAAQSYISHKELMGMNTDEQIALLKERHGIDWRTDYNDGEKYGRFIYKEVEPHSREVNGKVIEYERNVWKSHYAMEIRFDEGKRWFIETLIKPCNIPEPELAQMVDKTVSDVLSENSVYCEKILSNLSYLGDLSESFPINVSDDVENTADDQFDAFRALKAETDMLISNINN